MPSSVLSATASGHDHKPQHKGFRRPILQILDDLKKPVDRRFIKTKTIKGNRIDYIPWMTLMGLAHNYQL